MSVRGRRAASTTEGRERVVAGALELLDTVGLDGLTMRTLADRLGMRAASLYWHIRDKEQLLGLLAEAILAEVATPAAASWREHLEAFAADYRRVLHAHRDAAWIVMQVQPAAPQLYERLVRPLLDAGFDGGVALEACHLLAATYVPATVAGEQGGAMAGPEGEPGVLRAPLGSLAAGRLEMPTGISDLTLRGSAALDDLFTGRFEGRQPTLEVREGTVRITKRPRALQFRSEPCEVVLNTSIPWGMALGSAWKVDADLRGLRLGGVFFDAGAGRVTLRLPPPVGTVPVRFVGGVHKVTITRPKGVPARARISGGGAKLTLDTLHLTAAGETNWETPDFAAAENRYDVSVDHGSNEFTLTMGGADEDVAPPPRAPAPSDPGSPLAEAHPTPAAAAETGDDDPDARFEFGLQLLLDGLERHRPDPGG